MLDVARSAAFNTGAPAGMETTTEALQTKKVRRSFMKLHGNRATVCGFSTIKAPFRRAAFVAFFLATTATFSAAADQWPQLPERDGAVMVPGQEWPERPGPREVRVGVYYPDGTRASVGPRTGIFLCLHNWGGLDTNGTANPQAIAREFNVVALSVRYLQSGEEEKLGAYDFGWIQGLDALRALWLVYHRLDADGTPFARGRIFATGGSGGGNVSLMANKLAPRTFACVVDMCGMKKLNDAIAYNLPGNGGLNARWSRDPASPQYLAPGAQEIRFVGHPAHLAEMKRLGTAAKVVSVHGVDDKTCLADGREMVANMQAAGIDVVPHWVTKEMVDGKIFTTTGHALGNRTLIPGHVAGKWLKPDGPESLERKTPTDFEHRDEIRYATTDGVYVISYKAGYPVGRFEPAAPIPEYSDHFDLLSFRDADGNRRAVNSKGEWETRRRHIVAALERVMGPFPNPARRGALDVVVHEETKLDGGIVRRKISYQSDATDRVAAYLFLPVPALDAPKKLPAMLCLHPTLKEGKAGPAGLAGKPQSFYALELARRGYVTLAPDYPSFGDSKFDFSPRHGYASASMKAVWDNVRAIDLLETLPEVDAGRVGAIGHSLGAHNAIFTAVFDSRVRAVVASCGFTTLKKDDVPSWTGANYMPRIRSDFGNDAARVPFDFPELLAAIAPRPLIVVAAEEDSDFDVGGVRETVEAARAVYKLFGAESKLAADYPPGPHAFPDEARRRAYERLDAAMK
jgi:dienelactone hydrolase